MQCQQGTSVTADTHNNHMGEGHFSCGSNKTKACGDDKIDEDHEQRAKAVIPQEKWRHNKGHNESQRSRGVLIA